MAKNWLYTSLKISLFFLSFCFVNNFLAQEVILPGVFTDFSVDPLGNVYTITKQDTLCKHTTDQTQKTYFYSNSRMGKITSMDTSNPLKIIVSHGDFSTLVLLDVTLRETAQIYLPDLNIFSNPVAYAYNNDGTIWLYDDAEAQLLRVNQNSEIIFRAVSLIQKLDFVPVVNSMKSNAEYLVLLDQEKGFIVCDQFGEVIKFIPQKGIANFQLLEQAIVFQQGQNVLHYPLEVFSKKILFEISDSSTQTIITENSVYTNTGNAIEKKELKPN